MTPGTRWKANSTLQKHPAANVACCCSIFTLRKKKSENKIRALLLVLLPSTHKTSKIFSFSLSCLNPDSPNLNLQKLSKDLTPQNSTSQPKKKSLAPRVPLYEEDVQDNSKSDNWNTYSLQKQGQIYTKCTERRDKSRSEEKRRSSQEGEAKQRRERERDRGKKSSLGE